MLALTRDRARAVRESLRAHESWQRASSRAYALRRRTSLARVNFERDLIAIARALRAIASHAGASLDDDLRIMASVALLKWSRGTVDENGGDSRPRPLRSGARSCAEYVDERTDCERETLYDVLELMMTDGDVEKDDRWRNAMDLNRIKEFIRETSAIGSERRDADVCEEARRILRDDNDLEGAIAVLRVAERQGKAARGQKIWHGGAARRRMLALCERERWLRAVKKTGRLESAKRGARFLQLKPRSEHRSRDAAGFRAGDADAMKFSNDALRALDAALRDDAGDATCAIAQAQIHLFQGNFNKARDVLQKCLLENPDDADANGALAELLINARVLGKKKIDVREIVGACAAALRVDATAREPLDTLWDLADIDDDESGTTRKHLLEALASCVEEQPSNCRAWVMLATMLSGALYLDGLPRGPKKRFSQQKPPHLEKSVRSTKSSLPSSVTRSSKLAKGAVSVSLAPSTSSVSATSTSNFTLVSSSWLSSSHTMSSSDNDDERSSDSDSSDSDSSDDGSERPISRIVAKAKLYNAKPIDPSLVSHVFNEDRLWWMNSMFNVKNAEIQFNRKSELILWRARHVVASILYPKTKTTNQLNLHLFPHKVQIPDVEVSFYNDAFPPDLIKRCEKRSIILLWQRESMLRQFRNKHRKISRNLLKIDAGEDEEREGGTPNESSRPAYGPSKRMKRDERHESKMKITKYAIKDELLENENVQNHAVSRAEKLRAAAEDMGGKLRALRKLSRKYVNPSGKVSPKRRSSILISLAAHEMAAERGDATDEEALRHLQAKLERMVAEKKLKANAHIREYRARKSERLAAARSTRVKKEEL